ncbi:hypothetical protein JYU14_01235 [Simkania negevensis]|uniref:Plastocyanin-like domain-containing protein n=1 Tax=Simkania negevensis TaxID=83561 RepID=A0ABS3AQS9_9BACT|nr:hypothetical protein [Simkania negevensis]
MFLIKSFFIYLFLLLATTAVHAKEELYLKESIATANPGDYVIIQQGETLTLLHIQNKTDNSILFEEVSAPAALLPLPRTQQWESWLWSNAPGHTSWSLFEITLANTTAVKHYSFSRGTWLHAEEGSSFLSTLLSIPFEKIPPSQRRKTGSSTGVQSESSPIWQPPVYFQGERKENIYLDAWRGTWPKDSSPLSKKQIEIYLPTQEINIPRSFPYWIQIANDPTHHNWRIIDSGTHLSSPKVPPPR